MTTQKTLAIIKPDAYSAGFSGKIIDRIIDEGFNIISLKVIKLTSKEASGFYQIHKQKPFFEGLISFMTSGKCILLALEHSDAINHWRQVIGNTNPKNASQGTIRDVFGSSIEKNAVHGSDSPENGLNEILYFFSKSDIYL